MATTADLYETLQVHPAAEAEVIQAAYRRLAQKYHPDVNPGPDAQRRMAALNDAYAVLSDAGKRAAYDKQRSGRVGPTPAAASPKAGPVLQVLPEVIDFGTVAPGATRVVNLRVLNRGGGRMQGMVVCKAPWLKATPTEFAGDDTEVALRFQGVAAGTFQATNAVEVYSNGGRVSVSVKAVCGAGGAGAPAAASAGAGAGGARPTGNAQGWQVARPPRREVAKPWQPLQLPYPVVIGLGVTITSAVWIPIFWPVALAPAGLGLWLLWRRHTAEQAQQRQAAQNRSKRAPTSLGRCGACGHTVDPRAARKCSHCGGTICGHCGVCPCGRARAV